MDEALIRRTMPNSMEAEQSVIAAMLMDSDAVLSATELITADDFYNSQYKVLFQAIIDMYSAGVPIDLLTLQDKLSHMDVPPELGSVEFLKDLLGSVAISANVKYYARIVREKAILRNLIRATEDIANTCYVGKETVDDILEETEKKIFGLVQNRGTGDYVPIRQVVINAMEKIEAVSKTRGTVTGVPTGFIDLDYKTSGFQNSDLILVAARPSMGKTAFVLNVAEHMAFRKNVTVAIFSLEMSKEQLVNRLFSLESNVDSQKIRTGDLEDSDWERLIESANVIGNSNLIIDDTPSISIGELRSKCRKYKF